MRSVFVRACEPILDLQLRDSLEFAHVMRDKHQPPRTRLLRAVRRDIGNPSPT
ncbi:hypothetical protein BamMEX5DRAFT_3577 [Burkholderia ambifaria MEX-5]|uniref:Uncharacterized protein n=1 Tax=Burkholderia ambifaria MEX-5 TaxID=396597 RepID=B1T700_9BURK|nr:hypothetical protein BamMEX5DRAFT_3577 [Burkholderia ambifaria MEX-5]